MKSIETKVSKTGTGDRIETAEHDWNKQCSWVNHDGSHCDLVKVAGSDLCEAHRIVAG